MINNIFLGWLLGYNAAKLEEINSDKNKTRYYYNSFDGSTKYCLLGQDFFNKVSEEKNIIKSLPLYLKIIDRCSLINNRELVLNKMNSWVLPDEIFELMPNWWVKNDIQNMSPSVTAIHEIIKEELK